MGDGPYTTEEATVPQYVSDYAAPTLESGSPYTNLQGWATPIQPQPSAQEYPSAHRLATIPLLNEQPAPDRPPEDFYRRKEADKAHHHSKEKINPTQREAPKGVTAGDLRYALNPRFTPPPEIRWTGKLSPSTYLFTRPFGQYNRTHGADPATGVARYLNGDHFSMADHRRKYEILGMQPPPSRRNTFRLEPGPWDVDIVDMPPRYEPDSIQARLIGFETQPPRRSYRL